MSVFALLLHTKHTHTHTPTFPIWRGNRLTPLCVATQMQSICECLPPNAAAQAENRPQNNKQNIRCHHHHLHTNKTATLPPCPPCSLLTHLSRPQQPNHTSPKIMSGSVLDLLPKQLKRDVEGYFGANVKTVIKGWYFGSFPVFLENPNDNLTTPEHITQTMIAAVRRKEPPTKVQSKQP